MNILPDTNAKAVVYGHTLISFFVIVEAVREWLASWIGEPQVLEFLISNPHQATESFLSRQGV